MEPEKFWELSYYEWSLWLLRIKHQARKRKQDQEVLIELERNSMALMVNLWSKKKVSGRDFYTLSSDGEEKAGPAITGEQLMEKMKERFKDKPVKKRG